METLSALLIALINLSVQYLFVFFYFAWTLERTTCWVNVSLIKLRQTYVLILQRPISSMIRVFNVWQNSAWWFPKQTHLTLVDTTSLNKSVHLITQLLQVRRLHRGIPNEPLGSCHSPRMDKPKKISPTEEWSPRQQKWKVKNIALRESYFLSSFKQKFWFWPELYVSNSGIFLSSPEVTWLLLVFPSCLCSCRD